MFITRYSQLHMKMVKGFILWVSVIREGFTTATRGSLEINFIKVKVCQTNNITQTRRNKPDKNNLTITFLLRVTHWIITRAKLVPSLSAVLPHTKILIDFMCFLWYDQCCRHINIENVRSKVRTVLGSMLWGRCSASRNHWRTLNGRRLNCMRRERRNQFLSPGDF